MNPLKYWHFCMNLNILRGNSHTFWEKVSHANRQKLDFSKMTEITNVLHESYFSKLVFFKENSYQADQINFWLRKLMWNFEIALFLSVPNYRVRHMFSDFKSRPKNMPHPVLQFTRYQKFPWACWFLCKNVANFGR